MINWEEHDKYLERLWADTLEKMKKEITIKVCGGSGSGKSTIALAIHEFLLTKGIVAPISDISFFIDHEHQENRLEVISKNRRVCIETVQLNKAAECI